MLHTCDTCGYNTKRLWTFNKHLSRKNKCEHVEKAEVVVDNTTINACNTCNKIMSTQKALKKHEMTCSLQCPTCLKYFSDKTAKSRHINTIVCKPVENFEEENKRLGNVVANAPSEGDLRLKDAENNMVKIENDMLKKDIENRRLKNINEALKKELETLSNKTKPKRGFVNQVTRNKIAASQKWCCSLCEVILPGVFNIDHTIPLRYGGGDIRENVTALCIQCHAEKTQTDFELYDKVE
jgi:hypothetical protein